MKLALYHPTEGYYERDAHPIGRQGDFFTSVSVGRLFGELLGFQLGNWLEKIPTADCCLVEAGAHDGQLAFDVLGYLRVYRPAVIGADPIRDCRALGPTPKLADGCSA
jgi:SAM-dependent MidA family methyltransferase